MTKPLPRTCRITQQPFEISPAELAQLERMGLMGGLLKEPLPLPSIHPYEFLRQFFSHSNLVHLFRTYGPTEQSMLTRFDPALGFNVCSSAEFFSAAVDNRVAGQAYDFNRPFFDQWHEVARRSRLPALNSSNIENSDYVNGAENVRNCYLCFNISNSADCLYCISQFNGHDNLFCVNSSNCRFCFDCADISRCYECQACDHCSDCSGCVACTDCIGCTDCFGCVGLRQASYHVHNERRSKADYAAFLAGLNLGSHSARLQALARAGSFIAAQSPRLEYLTNCEDVSGNWLHNSARLQECYFGEDCQDCGYLVIALSARDCWHGFAISSELGWRSGPYKSYNTAFCYSVQDCRNLLYCYYCYQNCADCFGCTALRGHQYCLLNRQYTKQEFLDLLPRVIAHMQSTGEWGEFFPPRLAPVHYTDSAVHEFIEPIPEQSARRRGYCFPENAPTDAAASPGAAQEIPDHISEIDPQLWGGRKIVCVDSGRAFNLQRAELEFYRRFNVPLPRTHWLPKLRELSRRRGLAPTI